MKELDKWILVVYIVFMVLIALDIGSTYYALSTGIGYEAFPPSAKVLGDFGLVQGLLLIFFFQTIVLSIGAHWVIHKQTARKTFLVIIYSGALIRLLVVVNNFLVLNGIKWLL